jgi:hypothetical protein
VNIKQTATSLQRAKFDLEQLRLVILATIETRRRGSKDKRGKELVTILEKLIVIQGLETQLAESKERADASEKARMQSRIVIFQLSGFTTRRVHLRDVKKQQEESLAHRNQSCGSALLLKR